MSLNGETGGKRSDGCVKEGRGQVCSVEVSIAGMGERDEFRDLSGPQGRTKRETTVDEDERARSLLGKFAVLDGVRGIFVGVGGIVGLVTALA